MAIKIIIAGSRSFTDYDFAKSILDELIPVGMDVEIVSGTAKGADQRGERYAKEKASQSLALFLIGASTNEVRAMCATIKWLSMRIVS